MTKVAQLNTYSPFLSWFLQFPPLWVTWKPWIPWRLILGSQRRADFRNSQLWQNLSPCGLTAELANKLTPRAKPLYPGSIRYTVRGRIYNNWYGSLRDVVSTTVRSVRVDRVPCVLSWHQRRFRSTCGGLPSCIKKGAGTNLWATSLPEVHKCSCLLLCLNKNRNEQTIDLSDIIRLIRIRYKLYNQTPAGKHSSAAHVLAVGWGVI